MCTWHLSPAAEVKRVNTAVQCGKFNTAEFTGFRQSVAPRVHTQTRISECKKKTITVEPILKKAVINSAEFVMTMVLHQSSRATVSQIESMKKKLQKLTVYLVKVYHWLHFESLYRWWRQNMPTKLYAQATDALNQTIVFPLNWLSSEMFW